MLKQHVKIFLASSGELAKERKAFISILNQVNKSHPHLILEPIEWEYDLVSGSNPGYETIQGAINPFLEDASFLVFVFYSKLGKYTKEEFDLATERGKKLFAFFKSGFAANNEIEKSNYKTLLSFKESLNDTVLYKDYSTLTQFELKLKDDLHLFLSSSYSLAKSTVQPLSPEITLLIQENARKGEEIKKLQAQLEKKPNEDVEVVLLNLLKEKQSIQSELAQREEIIANQEKDKMELTKQLKQYEGSNEVKAKAFQALEQGDYQQAEQLLKDSAQQSIDNTANTFYELGKINKLKFDYKEAYKYFDLCLKINNDHKDCMFEASQLAGILGYYAEEVEHLEALIGLPQATTFDRAYLLNFLGIAYGRFGNQKKSIECLEEALSIYKEVYGESNEEVATILNNLGLAFYNEGEFDKSIEIYHQALSIFKSKAPNPILAIAHSNLGLVFWSKGLYDKAIQEYHEALRVDAENVKQETTQRATYYSNLGAAHADKGEYQIALDFNLKSLSIYEQYFGDSHPDIAGTYNNIGSIYNSLGNYDLAIEYINKALAMFLKFHTFNHPTIAGAYLNLGKSYNYKQEFDTAISYYNKALELAVEDSSVKAVLLNNIGLAYYSLGKYEQVIDYYSQAIQIAKHVYGDQHPELATYLNNLGLAFYTKQEFEDAIQYFQKAVAMNKLFLPETHPFFITMFNNLGMAYYLVKQFENSIESFNKAKECIIKNHGEEYLDTAICYCNLAMVHFEMQENQISIEFCERALQIFQTIDNVNELNEANVYYLLGDNYLGLKENHKAISYIEKSKIIYLEYFDSEHELVKRCVSTLNKAQLGL